VVPCGVDLRRFGPHVEPEPRPERLHRIVCASRLVERKGTADLVEALAYVDGAEMHIAGGPEASALGADLEARRLRRLAERHGVGDRLVLRGRLSRDGIARLMASADVVACAPWYEPFGIVPLEAMACGVPVVATSVGGQIDSVVHGRTGLHVPPRDPAALGAALAGLLADPARREAFSAAGRARARAMYDFERIAASTRAVYAEVAPARFARRASDGARGPSRPRPAGGAA
jgi:glycosyltransferase involved in cell wall biosynthesis